MKVVERPANIADREKDLSMLAGSLTHVPTSQQIWLGVRTRSPSPSWATEALGLTMTFFNRMRRMVRVPVIQAAPLPRLKIQPRRWEVELTVAWLGPSHRIIKESGQARASIERSDLEPFA